MALERRWSCDRCGHQKTVNSLPNQTVSQPYNWIMVDVGTAPGRRNIADHRLLCPSCVEALKQFVEQKSHPLSMADIEPDPRVLGASESGYRRGVAQALSLAGDLVRNGGTADDLDQLTDLSMDWRHDRKPHLAYLDELMSAWRRGERGVTGLDLPAVDGHGDEGTPEAPATDGQR